MVSGSIHNRKWGEFLHSLGRKQSLDFVDFGVFERPLSGKAVIQASVADNL
jgi:hypothetical protein